MKLPTKKQLRLWRDAGYVFKHYSYKGEVTEVTFSLHHPTGSYGFTYIPELGIPQAQLATLVARARAVWGPGTNP